MKAAIRQPTVESIVSRVFSVSTCYYIIGACLHINLAKETDGEMLACHDTVQRGSLKAPLQNLNESKASRTADTVPCYTITTMPSRKATTWALQEPMNHEPNLKKKKMPDHIICRDSEIL